MYLSEKLSFSDNMFIYHILDKMCKNMALLRVVNREVIIDILLKCQIINRTGFPEVFPAVWTAVRGDCNG